MTRSRSLFLLPFLAITTLFAVACGGGDDDEPQGDPGSNVEATATTQSRATNTPDSASKYTNASAKKLAAVSEPLDLAKGNVIGREDAKVTLTVFEDFQCPHCLNYTINTEPVLMEEYVKTGKLKIEFKHFPILGAESVYAAAAGVCAAKDDQFWQLKKILFLAQAEAGQLTGEKLNVGRFSQQELTKYAVEAGMNETEFTTCFLDPATVDTLASHVTEAQTAGIRGTPGFILDGVAQAGQPTTLDGWRKLLDDAIAKK